MAENPATPIAEAPPPIAVPNYQPQLYDATGQPLDLTLGDAEQAIAAGKAGYLKGTQVHVVTQDGTVGTIPSHDVARALGQGMRLATNDEVHTAKVQKKYGGLAGQATTAALGAASGLSLGATDFLASQLPGGREYVEEHREANPGTFLGGKVVGAVAPALVGDEAGLLGVAKEGAEAGELARGAEAVAKGADVAKAATPLAESSALPAAASAEVAAGAPSIAGQAARSALDVAAAPTRAVSKLGDGIEKVVSGVLGGEGEGSLVTRMAKKALTQGARGVAEGAVYGAADELDEDTLGDHEVNGEKLLAAMGHGALLGLAGGGLLGAGGELGSAALGRAAPQLRKLAAEQAARSLNMRVGFTREIDRLPGKFQGFGERLLDTTVDGQPLIRAGDRVEDIAPRIAQASDEAGERVGTVYDTLDKAEVPKPTVQEITDGVRGKVLTDLEKMPGVNRTAINEVKTWMGDLAHQMGIPDEATAKATNVDREALLGNTEIGFRQLQAFKSDLGHAINWKVSPIPGVEDKANEALKGVYHALSDVIDERAEKAANKIGGSLRDELKEANLAYRQLLVANRAAQDSVLRGEANRVISPSDYITGAAMAARTHIGRMVAGGAAGSAVGGYDNGPEGAVAGLATGALGALAHHAIRTRGNSTAAVVLDKLSALRGIERAAVHMDNQIERGVGGIFREPGRVRIKTRPPLEGERGEHVSETAARKVIAQAARPEQHAETIERAAAPIATHAPKVANAFQRAALRATMYLAEQAPKSVGKPSITPQFDKPMLSDAQRSDYARVVAAVHDPATVLADMEAGRVTRSQVDALRMVYPALYGEIVQRVHERLADLKRPLDYGQKAMLSVLLGEPADETFAPGFVEGVQATYQQGPAPAPQGGRGRGGHALRRPMKDDLSHDVDMAIGPAHGR